MDERPPPPPEGKLIATALAVAGMSIREASRRAGISYGRWRQVTSGYQNVSPGSYARVRAPARTLARMARVVRVSPERLATEGQRPDAAEMLREILRLSADGHDRTDDSPEGLIRRLDLDEPMDDDLRAALRKRLTDLLREGDERKANGGETRRHA